MACRGFLPHLGLRVHFTLVPSLTAGYSCMLGLTCPCFWSLLPSTILDWVVITVSVSPSVDAMKHADTSCECYLKYFACRPHRTDLLLVGAHEHYSGCTSLHLRKRITTGVTHHPPAWHTSHIYMR